MLSVVAGKKSVSQQFFFFFSVKSALVLFVSSTSKGCFCSHQQDLPDIIFIGEKYDDSGVWVLPQSADDLVVLRLLGLPGDLDRLGDAHATYTCKGKQCF